MKRKVEKKGGYWGFIIIGLIAFFEGIFFLPLAATAMAEMKPLTALLLVILGIFFIATSVGIHNRKKWAFYGGMTLGIKYLITFGTCVIVIVATTSHGYNRLTEKIILDSAISIIVSLTLALGIIIYLYKHRQSFK